MSCKGCGGDSDLGFFIFLIACIILCSGDPDLLDAIIAWVNRQ